MCWRILLAISGNIALVHFHYILNIYIQTRALCRLCSLRVQYDLPVEPANK